jgi:hypothetical protein
LGMNDVPEFPKPIDKITPDDLNDKFLKSIGEGSGGDIATLKLYMQRVCPQIRGAYDKNIFLNQLIEDLYMQAENSIIGKQTDIEKLNKRIEKLNEANELFEAMGSDADKDPEAFVDNEGNPIKMRKKRTKMDD